MTLRKAAPRAKSRWTLLVVAVATLTLAVAMATQATLNTSLFELDKDASNDTLSTKIGVLNAALNNTALSTTICQDQSDPYDGETILVDAERMTLSNGATVSGGGCPSDYPNKRGYTVGRAADGTTAGAHAKAEDVTLLDFTPQDGDDWDDVYDLIAANPGGSDEEKCESLGAIECVWTHDGRAMSIFTQSKDYDEISGVPPNWQWRDQSVPDADELDDGFAVKYIDENGEENLFFGADRFATNGTKDAGFWFFHDEVATVPPANGGDGTFTGVHTEPDPGDNGVFCGGSPTPNCSPYDADDTGGDVLVLTTFTGGGAVTTIRVFEWIGPAGTTDALLERGAFGDCDPGPAGSLCATVNDTTIESPWPYSGKSEPANDEIASGGFLEGGVNLTDLGLEGCFRSFMATSRSSASLTADPKDFILGNFERCESEVTTTPADGAGTPLADSNENDIPDVQIGTGADGVDVTDTALIDVTGTQAWTGSIEFFICGPLTVGQTCDTGGVSAGSQAVDQDTPQPIVSGAVNLTSVGYYCWRGEFTSTTEGVPGDVDASEGECFEVLPVTPMLTTQVVDSEGNPLTEDALFGEPLYDLASLSGTANQPGDDGPDATYPSIEATNGVVANGTISFTLIGPDDCATVATGDGDNPETGVTVTGDDDYMSSGFTPDLPGDYHWQASYSGDSPNTLGTSHNDECDDTAEDVTVLQLQPTMDTAQSFIPNDSATITVEAGAGDLDGDVTFYMWVDDATCGAGDLGTADQTFGPFAVFAADGSSDPLTDDVETDNTTRYSDSGTTFHWIAVFESNTGSHLDVTSGCGNEHSSITIDNGVTQPPTP